MDELFKNPEEGKFKQPEDSESSQAISPVSLKEPEPEDTRPKELSTGDLVEGRYKIVSYLGRGAVGCVYKVEQVFLKKFFALKTLNPIFASTVTMRRLQIEAQATSRLEHANIVKSVDFGMIDGSQPFLVMDFVEGETLASYLKPRGSLKLSTALRIFIPICEALSFAHEQGVVHRDLKPSNIMLGPDTSTSAPFIPKIVDFGIAKLDLSGETELTKTGEVFGTPLYMSPEQCSGTKVDNRSDIYSLGCVLFETLTGTPPFRGKSSLETLMQHRTEKAPTLREASLGQEFSVDLEKIVATMLAKEPADRYQNFSEVAQDLLLFEQGQGKRTLATQKSTPTAKKATQSQLFWIIPMVLTVVAASIAGTIWVNQTNRPQSTVEKRIPVHDEFFITEPKSTPFDGASFLTTSEGANKRFRFPKDYNIGDLIWWNEQHKLQIEPATGVVHVTMPANVQLIFRGGRTLSQDPKLMTGFRNTKLAGVIFARTDEFDDQGGINQMLANLMPLQKELRCIVIANTTITPPNLETIGNLVHLKWLVLRQSATTSGSSVADLKNLAALQVLALQNLDQLTPILKKLAQGSSIQRLSLTDSPMSVHDVKLLSDLKSLSVLNLRGTTVPVQDAQTAENLFDQLATLKNLKRLNINSDVFGKPSVALWIKFVRRMKKLENFIIADTKLNPQQLNEIIHYLPPHCKFAYDPDPGKARPWFDPTKEDPVVNKLW